MVKPMVTVALAVTLCGQAGTSGDTVPFGVTALALPLVSAHSDQNPSSSDSPATPPAGCPPYAFERVPGWLAFATSPRRGDESFGWSPVSQSHQVALFADDLRPWEGTPAGRRFMGIGSSGVVPLVFTGVGRHKYGCDNNTEEMATFVGERMAEGAVWLLPAGATGVVSVPITVTIGAGVDPLGAWSHVPSSIRAEAGRAPAARVYVAGRISVAQYATGHATVKSLVVIDGRVAFERVDTKHYMEGAAPDSVDLNPNGHRDIGIPQPIGAFRFGVDWPLVIVLWNRAYEGNRFNVLRIDAAGVRLLEGPYLYYCAF